MAFGETLAEYAWPANLGASAILNQRLLESSANRGIGCNMYLGYRNVKFREMVEDKDDVHNIVTDFGGVHHCRVATVIMA